MKSIPTKEVIERSNADNCFFFNFRLIQGLVQINYYRLLITVDGTGSIIKY